MDHSSHAVLANAERLFADAQLLFAAARYPSALALGVLALEEVGKYLMFKSDDAEFASRSRQHVAKQRAAGSLIMAQSFVKTIEGYLEENDLEIKPVKELNDVQRAWYETEFGKNATRAYADELLTKMTDGLMNDGAGDAVDLIRSGQLNRLKKVGFYVDIEDCQEKAAFDFTKDQAEQILTITQRLLSIYKRT